MLFSGADFLFGGKILKYDITKTVHPNSLGTLKSVDSCETFCRSLNYYYLSEKNYLRTLLQEIPLSPQNGTLNFRVLFVRPSL